VLEKTLRLRVTTRVQIWKEKAERVKSSVRKKGGGVVEKTRPSQEGNWSGGKEKHTERNDFLAERRRGKRCSGGDCSQL